MRSSRRASDASCGCTAARSAAVWGRGLSRRGGTQAAPQFGSVCHAPTGVRVQIIVTALLGECPAPLGWLTGASVASPT